MEGKCPLLPKKTSGRRLRSRPKVAVTTNPLAGIETVEQPPDCAVVGAKCLDSAAVTDAAESRVRCVKRGGLGAVIGIDDEGRSDDLPGPGVNAFLRTGGIVERDNLRVRCDVHGAIVDGRGSWHCTTRRGRR
jgi:hypothetical protein